MTLSPQPTAFSTGTEALADSVALGEDSVSLSLGRVLTLDVLANDLAGATLWSVGRGNTFDALKTDDTAGNWERSGAGNQIRIVNGKVEVDLTATLARYAGSIEGLGAGQTITDFFFYTIRLADNTLALARAEFTITGANDRPTITSAARTISLTEDVTTTASGQFTATDPDVGSALTYSGSTADDFGTFAVSRKGLWTFALKSGPAVNALAEGEEKRLVYTVTVSDGSGGTATQDVSIVVTGTNDAPRITAARTAGTIIEDSRTATIAGQITATDIDRGDSIAFSAAAVTPNATDYGSLSVNAAGLWTFALRNASPAVQSLAAGETKILSYTVTATDALGAKTETTVLVTVTGTNDAPRITAADTAGTVAENGTLTRCEGTITATDIDNGDTVTYALLPSRTTPTGFGTFLVEAASGKWTFDIDNASASVQSLAEGQSKLLSYVVLASDGKGGLVRQPVTVTITGTNDAPVLGISTDTGAVTEDARPATASGRIVVTDIDSGDVLTYSQQPKLPEYSSYGTFTVDRTGRWGFTLNNASSAVQALAAGETKVLEFDVTARDKAGAVVVDTVSITVTGINDAALFTNTNARASVTEDGVTQTGGILTVTDKDAGQAAFKAPAETSLAGLYGQFSFNAQTGAWGYTLDNASAAVQALGATDVKTDSLTIQSLDGTSHTINVTVNGAADAAPPPPPPPVVVLAAVDNSADRYDIPDDAYTSNRTATFGNDEISVGAGGGMIDGRAGDDHLFGSTVQDTIYGNMGEDELYGNAGSDALQGDLGNDILYGGSGNDSLGGGDGNDILIGGHGADSLSGGTGNDTFIFYEPKDSGDRITDFKGFSGMEADRISVGNIDADSTVAFRQQLVWGGTTATAHGLWYADGGTGTTTVYADTDGDTTTAEFWFTLNTVPLAETDFIFTP